MIPPPILSMLLLVTLSFGAERIGCLFQGIELL